MIDDIALLKQAMEQMDAEDPAVAQAAKDRAAQALADAGMNFSKMAGLIEQRGLLLRPRILAGIKRMDQPGMLGDSAFRDTGSALRKDGQSFYQIAEALELSDRPGARYENPVRMNEPPYQMPYQMVSEPGTSAWWRALTFAASIVFFPLLHPIRFLAIALVAILLFYGFRGFVAFGQQASRVFDGVAAVRHGADQAMSSVGSFLSEHIWRQSRDTTAEVTPPPTPPASIPSPPAATPAPPAAAPSSPPATSQAPPATTSAPPASAPPATAPAPSVKSVPPAPPSAAPVRPPVSTPRRDARSYPSSKWAEYCEAEPDCCPPEPRRDAPVADDPLRTFRKIIPEGAARSSRVAGPCVGGVGGCSWGGGQY